MWHIFDLSELKECFTMFDTTCTGVIAAPSVGTALRAIGQTPTEAELQELLQDALLDGIVHKYNLYYNMITWHDDLPSRTLIL